MRRLILRLAAVALLFAAPAWAQTAEEIDARFAETERLYGSGDYAAALAHAQETLAMAEAALGPDHATTIPAIAWVGFLYNAAGRTAEAEPLSLRALATAERTLGPEHPSTLTSVNNLANLYKATGRYAEAEPLYLRALEGFERTLGPEHPSTLVSIASLAGLYRATGRYAEAEPLYLRALEALERTLGPEHPNTLISVNNLALLYQDTGRWAQVEPLYLRALEAQERTLGPEHPDTLRSVNNLATLYQTAGPSAEAEPLYLRALEARERTLGPEHPDTLVSIGSLAALYKATGRHAEAEPLFVRALEGQGRTLGPEHPNTLNVSWSAAVNRADLRFAGTPSEAPADAARRVVLGALKRYGETFAARAVDDGQRYQNPVSAEYLATIALAATERLLAAGDVAPGDAGFAPLTFELAQAFHASDAGAALQASTAALASGDPEKLRLVKARADREIALRGLEAEFAAFVQQPLDERDPETEARLRADYAAGLRALEANAAAIEAYDPAFAALIAARVTKAAEVQSLLKPDEALVVYSAAAAASQDFKYPLLLAFVVTKDAVSVHPLVMTQDELDPAVAKMRAGLDPTGVKTLADLPDLDLVAAQALYARVFEPLREDLGSARRVFVVTDGALASLPLHALVVAPGVADPGDPYAIYRTTHWLGDDYAFATLPAVGSLAALRREGAAKAAGTKPLFGLGDPVMPRAARDDAPKGDELPEDPFAYVGMGPGDVTALSALADLPQTAALLRQLAAAVGADASDLKLGPEAQEATIRTLNADASLAAYRAIAFATHALVAGELAELGLSEPALVLSAPDGDANDPANDGLLRASEVVTLNLDAEIVLLVACNTAAADGAPNAGALSGLAKAFFYAGARSLLVSHWPAEANAAEALAPDLIKASARGVPRAEALKAAMIAVRNDPERPHFAHPALWAPFVVVGEGG